MSGALKKSTGLLLLVLAVLASCSRASEEDLIKEMAMEAARSVEEKDIKGFMGFLSKDFHDDKGNDYDAVKGILFHEFLKPGPIKVFMKELSVELKGERGVLSGRAVVARGEGMVPEDAEGLRFSILLAREEGGWKAIGANWQETGVAGVF